jgi:UDP-galactopyranose mutase
MDKWIPLMGSLVTVFGAGAIAYFATARLNTLMKQTEFFLKFTERFHAVMQQKHQLKLRLLEPNDTTDAKKIEAAADIANEDATEIYRQFFGLMFDEFFAYQEGFLAYRAFKDWMLWRNYEYNANATIGNIPYRQGWDTYSRLPVVRSEFKIFLEAIHDIKLIEAPPKEVGGNPLQKVNAVEVEKVIQKYRWPEEHEPVHVRIRRRVCEYQILIGVLGFAVLGFELIRAML